MFIFRGFFNSSCFFLAFFPNFVVFYSRVIYESKNSNVNRLESKLRFNASKEKNNNLTSKSINFLKIAIKKCGLEFLLLIGFYKVYKEIVKNSDNEQKSENIENDDNGTRKEKENNVQLLKRKKDMRNLINSQQRKKKEQLLSILYNVNKNKNKSIIFSSLSGTLLVERTK